MSRSRVKFKGSDWIRLVFTHPLPLNSRAPIASANFMHTHDGACPANRGSVIQDQCGGHNPVLIQSKPFLCMAVNIDQY